MTDWKTWKTGETIEQHKANTARACIYCGIATHGRAVRIIYVNGERVHIDTATAAPRCARCEKGL
jgi:hypothetical protein